MTFPLISEYTESIVDSKDSFKELSYLEPVFDEKNCPIMAMGNFSVVYKMKDPRSDKFKAIKCFIRDQEGRTGAYEKICKELSEIDSSYLIHVDYLENELTVCSSQTERNQFPILIMDWVEGLSLDKYIEQFKGNSFALYEVCYNFRMFAKWLVEEEIAHGDIKPENIIVNEAGKLILIDYDAMFVPSMANEKAREFGNPALNNPFFKNKYNKHSDDFALSVLSLSLKLISNYYDIQSEHKKGRGLLFSKDDFFDWQTNPLFQFIREALTKDPILGKYYATFIKAMSGNELNKSDFDFPEEKQLNDLLNYFGKEDKYEIRKTKGVESDNGLIYSNDGFYLIGFNNNKWNEGEELIIKEGTIAICEGALDYNTPRIRLKFPSSLRYFNPRSLSYKCSEITIESPWFCFSNGFILTSDKTECVIQYLKEASFDEEIRIIGANVFEYLPFINDWPLNLKRIRKEAFKESGVPDRIDLPEGLCEIGNFGFSNCYDLKEVNFPSTVIEIGEGCFSDCRNLEKIDIKNTQISDIKAFTFDFNKLTNIKFPETLKIIGAQSFTCCNFSKLTFPKQVTKIGDSSFSSNLNLSEITFQAEEVVIKECAFRGCEKLNKLEFETIRRIEKKAFEKCPIEIDISNKIRELEPGSITGAKILGCNAKKYYIENETLISKELNEIIYCWNSNDIVEIKEGIRQMSDNIFLHIPKAIVFPNSFDGRIIDSLYINSRFVLPPHFNNLYKFHSSGKIYFERIFIDSYGVVYTEDKSRLLYFSPEPLIEEYVVLSECLEIADNAFDIIFDFDIETGGDVVYTPLKKLHLPPHLIKIGKDALHCPNLEKLILPPSVKVVADGALRGCVNLKEIVIHSKIEQIGKNSFPENVPIKYEGEGI